RSRLRDLGRPRLVARLYPRRLLAARNDDQTMRECQCLWGGQGRQLPEVHGQVRRVAHRSSLTPRYSHREQPYRASGGTNIRLTGGQAFSWTIRRNTLKGLVGATGPAIRARSAFGWVIDGNYFESQTSLPL